MDSGESQSLMLGKSGRSSNRGVIITVVVLTACLVVLLSTVLTIQPNGNQEPDDFAAQVVASQAASLHLSNLYKQATVPNGKPSRSILNNYNTSVAYVQQILAQAGGLLNVTLFPFQAPTWVQNGPSTFQFGSSILVEDDDYRTARYSGGGKANSTMVVVNSCSAFNPSTDKIALVPDIADATDPLCSLYNRTLLAEAAGAAAVIVYSTAVGQGASWPRIRTNEWLPSDPFTTIPVVTVGHALGQILRASLQTRVVIAVNADNVVTDTVNVIAETTAGDPNSILVVGAHLDSVPAGPGINDNGSGAAALLSMVSVLAAKGLSPRNKIRFCWWGAEEEGLVGSRSYVRAQLDPKLQQPDARLKANLNFDMLASPNGVHFVYNGSTAPYPANTTSALLQQVFEGFFQSSGLPYEVIPFSTTGGSDYHPFIYSGIPAASIATGAGGIKDAVDRAIHGGLADTPYDPCYHQACDTLNNIDHERYDQQLAAASYAVWYLANSPDLPKFRPWVMSQ
eukprot:TRINITY_DN11819_c2_g1_i1.p1 TRINITY_DN11819_c2_g1~~TRINITY_DN11819_c2_g1_i1.p1  ORF type:complete len:510 (+),score=111.63 TRINITY_DN11819_c2_g1_i1:1185-2714(+)